MKKKIYSKRKIFRITLVVLAIAIKLFSLNEVLVEKWYSIGVYPYISAIFRFLLGWIPFSIGDVLYFLLGAIALFLFIRMIVRIIQKKYSWKLFASASISHFFFLIGVYCCFNLFWGLNYDRLGIAYQIQLGTLEYDSTDIMLMQDLLLKKVNENRNAVVVQQQNFPTGKQLFLEANQCYKQADKKIPFLAFSFPSAKSSMYDFVTNYMGVTGYYNPFTAEAQVNTSVPAFLQSFVALHEIGHQIGYAKEDEASFAGYLAAIHSDKPTFKYSTYLDLYLYVNREAYSYDSTAALSSRNFLIDAVKTDLDEWEKFDLAHQSIFGPASDWIYTRYLKMNAQPQGMRRYNMVVAMVMAHYRKYGYL